MPSTNLLRWLSGLQLIALFVFSAARLAAQTEEKLLDDINQLPEAERQGAACRWREERRDRHVVRRDEPCLCPRSDQRL